MPDLWLALLIGNSRLHWGAFDGETWLGGWDTPHLTLHQATALMAAGFERTAWTAILPSVPPLSRWPEPLVSPPLWLGSVVTDQAALWQPYPRLHRVEREHIRLQALYPTIGLDRALALLGAGVTYGWPVLVVDGGTALTFTAGDQSQFKGGAIGPGLGLQLKSLHLQTDALPAVSGIGLILPPRWATTTPEAILSGVFYTQLAGIRDFVADWLATHPTSQLVFTGGDGALLGQHLSAQVPIWADRIILDNQVAHWGLRAYRQGLTDH